MICCLRTSVSACRLIAGLLILCLGTGCWSSSSEIKRYAIEGEVTFNGQPIPGGTIEFEPDSEKGNRGPMSKAFFTDSRFSIDSDRGIIGGAYLVRIEGYTAPLDGNDGPGSITPQPLFPEHVISIELPTENSTQTFDVTAK